MPGIQPILTYLYKDATFSPPPNLHRCISLVEVYRFGQCLGKRFSRISTLVSVVSSRTFRDVPHSQFWCRDLKLCWLDFFAHARFGRFSNLHTCISVVEVYGFRQSLGWKFSPISTFFSLVSSHAFRDAPHSRFRCGNPNQCLHNFLKMLLLSLPQIYTGVFHLWKSIDLDSAWVRDSRPHHPFFSSKILRV